MSITKAPMIQTRVSISDRQNAWLTLQAERKDVSKSAILRGILNDTIETDIMTKAFLKEARNHDN